MVFQPSAFEPTPKPSRLGWIKGLGRALYTFVAPAKGLLPLEESAWQRGKRQADELANGRAILFMIVSAPIFAVGGLLFALDGVWWPLRVVIAALIGLAVAIAVVVSISGLYALRAPYHQRKEARDYALALEVHVQDYAQWARRREIAYDFRHDTLEDVRRLADERALLMGSVSGEEERWRGNVAQIRSQMQEHGADASVLGLLDRQMEALDSKDDGYGDNQLGRIRNSMGATCQNLWAEVVRQQGPPQAPLPPTLS